MEATREPINSPGLATEIEHPCEQESAQTLCSSLPFPSLKAKHAACLGAVLWPLLYGPLILLFLDHLHTRLPAISRLFVEKVGNSFSSYCSSTWTLLPIAPTFKPCLQCPFFHVSCAIYFLSHFFHHSISFMETWLTLFWLAEYTANTWNSLGKQEACKEYLYWWRSQ